MRQFAVVLVSILIIIVLLGASFLGVGVRPEGIRGSIFDPLDDQSEAICASIFSSSTINATVQADYGNFNYDGSAVSGVNHWTAQNNSFVILNHLCSNNTFQQAAAPSNPVNISLEYYSSDFEHGLQLVNYTFERVSFQQHSEWENEEWWSGNLSTLVTSGPFFQSAPAMFFPSAVTTHNWAGYEFPHDTGAPPSPHALYSEYATVDAINMTKQPKVTTQLAVPGTVTIDSAGAAWTGLENLPGGGGGMIQTGYVYDATHPRMDFCVPTDNNFSCKYGFWCESVGAPPFPGGPAFPYSGVPRAHEGDVIDEGVTLATTIPLTYDCYVKILNTGAYFQKTISFSNDTGWTPYYAPFIFEAPTLNVSNTSLHIQQMPNITYPLPGQGNASFANGTLCTSATICYQALNSWNNGWYFNDTMSQLSGLDITSQNFGNYCSTNLPYPCATVFYTPPTPYPSYDYNYSYV